MADALSRRYAVLLALEAKVLSFDSIKALHHEDEDFKKVVKNPSNLGCFTLQDGVLFKRNKLCILKCSLRELLVPEAYGGVLAGHFSLDKTIDILKEHFYWPKMRGDVHKIISACHYRIVRAELN